MSRWRALHQELAKRGRAEVLLLIPLLLALGLPHGLELDRYVTVDEPKWLMRSAGFYAALTRADFRGTFQREHPGVTVTWAGTAGYLLRFPGYFKVAPRELSGISRFHRLLRDYQKDPLDLLEAGRAFVVVINLTCLALAFLVTTRLIGTLPALFAFLLIAFDPYFTALTRLLHPDGLLGPATFLSLIAFLAYMYQGRDRRYLLLSALAAGLAWLTKSPALFLAPFVGLLVFIEWLVEQAHGFGRARRPAPTGMWRDLSPLLVWFGVGAVVFTLLWPAMWVDPLGSLSRVFSLASTYASEGHDTRLFFNGLLYEQGQSAWYFYPLAYLWRTTPVTLIGLGLALCAALFPKLLPVGPVRRRTVLSLALFAVLFGAFISLGEKKFDRYLVPLLAPLTLVSALGWLALAERLFKDPRRIHAQRWASGYLLGAVVLVQAAGLYQSYPYYLNYYNPLMGGDRNAPDVMMVGWGEGLDQAARYLNSLPEAHRAVAWYGDGCFSYFYDGQSITLDELTTLGDLRQDDHVVIYIDQLQRQLPSQEFLVFFEQFEPEYVVQIGSIEYARVYDMGDTPPLSAASYRRSGRKQP